MRRVRRKGSLFGGPASTREIRLIGEHEENTGGGEKPKHSPADWKERGETRPKKGPFNLKAYHIDKQYECVNKT